MGYRMDLLMAELVESNEVLERVIRHLLRAALIGVVDMQVEPERLDRLPAGHPAHEAPIPVALYDRLADRRRYLVLPFPHIPVP